MLSEWSRKTRANMAYYRITQQEIADEIGCTRAYVNMILNGIRTPSGGITEETIDKALASLVERAQMKMREEK